MRLVLLRLDTIICSKHPFHLSNLHGYMTMLSDVSRLTFLGSVRPIFFSLACWHTVLSAIDTRKQVTKSPDSSFIVCYSFLFEARKLVIPMTDR